MAAYDKRTLILEDKNFPFLMIEKNLTQILYEMSHKI
jgi:hypothetical protein